MQVDRIVHGKALDLLAILVLKVWASYKLIEDMVSSFALWVF